jgi:hypothetical protein
VASSGETLGKNALVMFWFVAPNVISGGWMGEQVSVLTIGVFLTGVLSIPEAVVLLNEYPGAIYHCSIAAISSMTSSKTSRAAWGS